MLFWYMAGISWGLLAIVLILKRMSKQASNETPTSQQTAAPDLRDTRKCPQCAEYVKKEAKVCRFCGYDLTPLLEADAVAAEQARLAEQARQAARERYAQEAEEAEQERRDAEERAEQERRAEWERTAPERRAKRLKSAALAASVVVLLAAAGGFYFRQQAAAARAEAAAAKEEAPYLQAVSMLATADSTPSTLAAARAAFEALSSHRNEAAKFIASIDRYGKLIGTYETSNRSMTTVGLSWGSDPDSVFIHFGLEDGDVDTPLKDGDGQGFTFRRTSSAAYGPTTITGTIDGRTLVISSSGHVTTYKKR